jgi:hypothetical protein
MLAEPPVGTFTSHDAGRLKNVTLPHLYLHMRRMAQVPRPSFTVFPLTAHWAR